MPDEEHRLKVVVVIDAFRAFATAAYVLSRGPATYYLATECSVISRLAHSNPNTVLIGKPGIGSDLIYDIPNSPTRTLEVEVAGRTVLHRTEAGAKGVLLAREADIVLAAGFVNADATAHYIRSLTNPEVTLIPMGHEGNTPSLEDDLCAAYISDPFPLSPYLPALREGPGKYFFSDDQAQYPEDDFRRCLSLERFDFILQAEVRGDYALLTQKRAERPSGRSALQKRDDQIADSPPLPAELI
jgi:2-phosphosulfolactate phosphatase